MADEDEVKTGQDAPERPKIEQLIVDANGRVEAAQAAEREATGRLSTVQAELEAANGKVAALESRLAAAESGKQVAELQTRLSAAEAEAAQLKADRDRVPAGSGERQVPDLTGLSATAKIRAGVAARSGGES